MIDIDWEFITEIVANIATFGALVVSLVALFITVRAYYQSGLPQIVVHIEADPDKNVFLFIVENTGKGVAFELSFSEIDSSIYDEKTVNYIKDTFIERGIPVLVPGGIRSTVISGPSGKLFLNREYHGGSPVPGHIRLIIHQQIGLHIRCSGLLLLSQLFPMALLQVLHYLQNL